MSRSSKTIKAAIRAAGIAKRATSHEFVEWTDANSFTVEHKAFDVPDQLELSLS